MKNKLLEALKEIIPSDDFDIVSYRKTKDNTYRVIAKDREYIYTVELLLGVRQIEEGQEYLTHRLLIFDYEEVKDAEKGLLDTEGVFGKLRGCNNQRGQGFCKRDRT